MNVWGAQVHPPSVDRALTAWLLSTGLIGRAERRFFESAVMQGQIVVDVGANQGIFTLLFSRLVGPSGRVFALEPAPTLCWALDRNCRNNAANNVTRLPTAAGETRSKGVPRCSRFNSGDNRLTDSLNGASVSVEIVPLDEILPTEQVSLVKIDVQGYELNVIKGMQGILDRSPTIKVFFEYWPSGLEYACCNPGELLEFFRVRGFSLFELSRAGPRKLDCHDLARSMRAGDWSWRYLLAAREQVAIGIS